MRMRMCGRAAGGRRARVADHVIGPVRSGCSPALWDVVANWPSSRIAIYPRRSRARRGNMGLACTHIWVGWVVSSRRPARHDGVSWARAGGGGVVVAIRSPDPAVMAVKSLKRVDLL